MCECKHLIKIGDQKGFSLVELMVSLVVTSILIAGTYAAYSFFNRQQGILVSKSDLDRNLVTVADLIGADIRNAGYKDYLSDNNMVPSQALHLVSANELIVVYDDYGPSNAYYRALIRYYLQPYTPAGGITRNRLMRDWRTCTNPSTGCTLSTSTTLFGTPNVGEPILDWVQAFTVSGISQKPTGTGSFTGLHQSAKVSIRVGGNKKVESVSTPITKSIMFVARARNISLVP